MLENNKLSKDEAKLIFGGVQTGSDSSGDNVNTTSYCKCPYINKSVGVTNSNQAHSCFCECVGTKLAE
jgi:hypothetical protein